MREFQPDFEHLEKVYNFDKIKYLVLLPLDEAVDLEYAVERISVLYPKLLIVSHKEIEAQDDCLYLFFACKPDFNIGMLVEQIGNFLSSNICLLLPLGYPVLVTFNDLNSNYQGVHKSAPATNFFSVPDIIKLLAAHNISPDITVCASVLALYARVLATDNSTVVRNFLNIVKNKSASISCIKVEEDLPYFYQICSASGRSSVVSDIELIKSQQISDEPTIGYYSVFDRLIGHENALSLATPIFVKPIAETESFLTVNDNSGFYETSNERCSELTAIHFILRRFKSPDILGFCHYRRFLDFSMMGHSDTVFHFDQTSSIIDVIESRVGIIKMLQTCDLIVANPLDLGNSQELHYCLSHYADDYYLMINQIIKKYPFLKDALVESMQSNSLYGSNLIIGKSGLVQYLFQIMFDVLDVFQDFPVKFRSKYQTRDVAFLSERVFDTIIRYYLKSGINIKVVPRVHLSF